MCVLHLHIPGFLMARLKGLKVNAGSVKASFRTLRGPLPKHTDSTNLIGLMLVLVASGSPSLARPPPFHAVACRQFLHTLSSSTWSFSGESPVSFVPVTPTPMLPLRHSPFPLSGVPAIAWLLRPPRGGSSC